mmetsp:Transcript_80897/g.224775  ORF Transcript_80897/g.224775 Transcript_80897/m.224775 type:complete len:226 (+) Transcript_80897:157-834(+)
MQRSLASSRVSVGCGTTSISKSSGQSFPVTNNRRVSGSHAMPFITSGGGRPATPASAVARRQSRMPVRSIQPRTAPEEGSTRTMHSLPKTLPQSSPSTISSSLIISTGWPASSTRTVFCNSKVSGWRWWTSGPLSVAKSTPWPEVRPHPSESGVFERCSLIFKWPSGPARASMRMTSGFFQSNINNSLFQWVSPSANCERFNFTSRTTSDLPSSVKRTSRISDCP